MSFRVGGKIKAMFIKEGLTSKGEKWQQINYAFSRKLPEEQRYITLMNAKIYNDVPIENLQEGEILVIKSIISLYMQEGEYLGRPYKNLIVNCVMERAGEDTPSNANTSNNKKTNNASYDPYENFINDLDFIL